MAKEEIITFKQEFDSSGCLDGGILFLDDVLIRNKEEFTISRTAIADGKEVIRQEEYEFDTVVYSRAEILFLRRVVDIFRKNRVEKI